MIRSLAVAALTLAGLGVACAQSVYLYLAPGASVYVTPTPNGPYYNGAPAVYPAPYPGPYPPLLSVAGGSCLCCGLSCGYLAGAVDRVPGSAVTVAFDAIAPEGSLLVAGR